MNVEFEPCPVCGKQPKLTNREGGQFPIIMASCCDINVEFAYSMPNGNHPQQALAHRWNMSPFIKMKKELDDARDALRSLWIGTVCGAGKGAMFEDYRSTLTKA